MAAGNLFGEPLVVAGRVRAAPIRRLELNPWQRWIHDRRAEPLAIRQRDGRPGRRFDHESAIDREGSAATTGGEGRSCVCGARCGAGRDADGQARASYAALGFRWRESEGTVSSGRPVELLELNSGLVHGRRPRCPRRPQGAGGWASVRDTGGGDGREPRSYKSKSARINWSEDQSKSRGVRVPSSTRTASLASLGRRLSFGVGRCNVSGGSGAAAVSGPVSATGGRGMGSDLLDR